MKKLLLILAPVALTLGGCAIMPTTSQSWSCRVKTAGTCSSIATIDQSAVKNPQDVNAHDGNIAFGSHPARWWAPVLPTAQTEETDPQRDGDQVMKILIAPWIDAQGDYHERSMVEAVMRKSDWWITAPIAAAAEPKPGTDLGPQAAAQASSDAALPPSPKPPAVASSTLAASKPTGANPSPLGK